MLMLEGVPCIFVSCEQSSELLTTDSYFILNKILLISFVLLTLSINRFKENSCKKRAVSGGVF